MCQEPLIVQGRRANQTEGSLKYSALSLHSIDAPQHCFEPADQGRQYRRMVAARLATQDSVVAHASEYIGRQLCAVADLLQSCARNAQTTAFPGASRVRKLVMLHAGMEHRTHLICTI